jgi:hypothetical protein
VKTDNIGAMFMAQIASSSLRTCHINTRYHFVRENREDRIIKNEFIKAAENDSNFHKECEPRGLQEAHKKVLEECNGEFGI